MLLRGLSILKISEQIASVGNIHTAPFFKATLTGRNISASPGGIPIAAAFRGLSLLVYPCSSIG
jgi:hypothetical protein